MRKKRKSGDGGFNVWRSYSDVMAGVLLLFILIMSLTLFQAQKSYDESIQERDEKLALQAEYTADLLAKQNTIEEQEGTIKTKDEKLTALAQTLAEQFTAQMEDFAQYQRLSYKTMEQVRKLLSEVTAANTRDVSLIASGRNDSMDKLADLIAEQNERQQALLEEINKNMKELSKAAQKGKFGLFR